MAKNVKVSKTLLTAASLLANAYIAARAGNKERAGEYMVAACRTDDLDAVMHGMATALGITDEDANTPAAPAAPTAAPATACDGGDCGGTDEEDLFADTDEEDLFADADDDDDKGDDDDDLSPVYEGDDADDDKFGDDKCPTCGQEPCTCEEETVTKVAVPASCARLARIRY